MRNVQFQVNMYEDFSYFKCQVTLKLFNPKLNHYQRIVQKTNTITTSVSEWMENHVTGKLFFLPSNYFHFHIQNCN